MSTPIELDLKTRWRVPLRIALLYLAVGGLWILFSDRLVAQITTDPKLLTSLQTYKGWFYIGVTALLLFWLMLRHTAQMQRSAWDLKQKDLAIRKAYADVFAAVTGNKLLIVTREELRRYLGEPLGDTRSVTSSEQLAEARAYLAETLSEFFPETDSFPLKVSACEALVNALKHGGGGAYRIFRTPKYIQALVSDAGSGIDFNVLPKAALVPGFSTIQTLGVGFSLMLELSERVLLATGPGGTNVVIEVALKRAPDTERHREVA